MGTARLCHLARAHACGPAGAGEPTLPDPGAIEHRADILPASTYLQAGFRQFFISAHLDPGYDSYSIRWQGPDYFEQQDYTYDPATGAYEGICGTRACSLYPPAWVQQEHWQYFVGTLLAKDAGTWTYSESRNGVEFQSRTFEVRELGLKALSGANQMGLVGTEIPRPLVLKLESFEGTGIGDEVIGWSIAGPKGAKQAAVYGIGSGSETDPEGIDRATIRLGTRPGVTRLR
jgi:hypothetical protein